VVLRSAAAASVIVLGMSVSCGHGSDARALRTEWHLDPGAARPNPTSRELHVIVAAIDCASGRPQDELIVGKEVAYQADEISIRFEGKKLRGFQTCPLPFPFWATRTVMLRESIGDRRLVDPGFGEPAQVRYPSDACAILDPSRDSPCPAPPGPNVSTTRTTH